MPIEDDVDRYLVESEGFYEVGQWDYYARLALQQAVLAYKNRDYGIGAVAILVSADTVREYPNRNTMLTGIGVVDHAETRALIDLRAGRDASRDYARKTNQWTENHLPEGITVFGTLEPCPMCACAMTNAGATLSISTVLDGSLVLRDGYSYSDGAANVIEEKWPIQPQVWRNIQTELGLQFKLLDTQDTELKRLSRRIFEDTRATIDGELAQRPRPADQSGSPGEP